MNDVCFSSSGYILIWLYPENLSIRTSPRICMCCQSSLVIGRGNLSLGQATFSSQKLLQIRIFSFFLGTNTMFATQSGACSSLIKLESMSFLTFDLIVSIISRRNHHYCCLTGFASGLMLSRCMAIVGQVQVSPHSSMRKCLYTPVWDVLDLLSRKVISFLL